MSEELKKCPSCGEFVKGEAFKCRYCAYFFNNNIFNKRHPQFGPMMVAISLMLLMFGGLFFVGRIVTPMNSNPKLAFDRAANEIVIQNDKLAYKKPAIGIIGEIKNNGKVNWYSVDVKAKLLNKNGEVVDLLEKQIYGLRPDQVKTFKLSSCCGEKSDPVEFDRYEVFVEDAVVNRW